MELSNNLDEAISQAKSHLRRNIQVKLLVRHQGREFETSTVFIRKIVPEKLEQIRKELVMRFGTKQFEKIYMEITKLVRKVKCPNCNKEMRSNNLFRHLKSCVKDLCVICLKSVENLQEHMKDCSVKYYSCKICGEKFNTGGRRTAHEKKCRVMEGATSKEALDGLFKIIRITPQPHPNYEGVLEEEANHISDILLYEIKTSLKFYISLEVRVYFEEKSQVANFQSSATTLLKSSNFIEQVRNHYEVLIEKIENYTSSTSGYNVENIEVINILITHVN